MSSPLPAPSSAGPGENGIHLCLGKWLHPRDVARRLVRANGRHGSEALCRGPTNLERLEAARCGTGPLDGERRLPPSALGKQGIELRRALRNEASAVHRITNCISGPANVLSPRGTSGVGAGASTTGSASETRSILTSTGSSGGPPSSPHRRCRCKLRRRTCSQTEPGRARRQGPWPPRSLGRRGH